MHYVQHLLKLQLKNKQNKYDKLLIKFSFDGFMPS